MKKIAMLFIASVTLFACNDDKKLTASAACDVDDPVNDLPWLKGYIERFEADTLKKYSRIVKAEYNGDMVFHIDSCCPMCIFIAGVYKCDGTMMYYEDEPGLSEIKDWVVIWQPKEFICGM